jgi:hypothetical protein
LVLTLNIGQIRGRVTLAGQPVANAIVTETVTGFPVQQMRTVAFCWRAYRRDRHRSSWLLPQLRDKGCHRVNGLNDLGTIALNADTNPNPPGPPAGTLIGKITLSDQASGTAGAGTTVFLLQNGVQIDQALTNANAEFGFYALPGAGYSILVRKNAYQDATSDVFAITDPSTPLRKDLTLDPN